MKEHNKRWLISMMKTSGSKRRYLVNGSFSEERNSKKYSDLDNLPLRESIKKTREIYNGKLNYGLLIRFLNNQVGNDWDLVYSEIISRIPTKLLDHKEIIFWFVADKVEIIEGKPFNKKTNKHIWTPEQGDYSFEYDYMDFYIDPVNNKLCKVADKPSSRKTKNMDNKQLRDYRQEEKNSKRKEKLDKKTTKEMNNGIIQELIQNDNRTKKGSR